MSRRTEGLLVLLVACLLGASLTGAEARPELIQAEAAESKKPDQGKAIKEFLGKAANAWKQRAEAEAKRKEGASKETKDAQVQTGSEKANATDSAKSIQKIRDWADKKLKPFMRGAQKAVEQSVGAVSKEVTKAAKKFDPDTFKLMTKANGFGFTADAIMSKDLPKDGRKLHFLAGHSGIYNPKMGTVGTIGSSVNRDGSAKAGAFGMFYSPNAQPVYASMNVTIPTRTEKGRVFMESVTKILNEGRPTKVELDKQLQAGLAQKLPEGLA